MVYMSEQVGEMGAILRQKNQMIEELQMGLECHKGT